MGEITIGGTNRTAVTGLKGGNVAKRIDEKRLEKLPCYEGSEGSCW